MNEMTIFLLQPNNNGGKNADSTTFDRHYYIGIYYPYRVRASLMYVFLFGDPEMIDPSERDDSLDSQLDSSSFIIIIIYFLFHRLLSCKLNSTCIQYGH